jgi:formate hydrogenlyase transcriptional activator
MNLLSSYDWPGNVRELQNVVERGVITSRNGTLRVDREELTAGAAITSDLDTELKTQERELIEAALTASRGRVSGPTGAAIRLGMPASTVEFRIKRLGIDKFRYRQRQGRVMSSE